MDGAGQSRHWSDCPSLDTNIDGLLGLMCNGATCAMRCQPGYIAVGNRRTKCRWNRRLGWFWKRKLGSCKTCDPATPTTTDPNMTVTCGINTSKFQGQADLRFPSWHNVQISIFQIQIESSVNSNAHQLMSLVVSTISQICNSLKLHASVHEDQMDENATGSIRDKFQIIQTTLVSQRPHQRRLLSHQDQQLQQPPHQQVLHR